MGECQIDHLLAPVAGVVGRDQRVSDEECERERAADLGVIVVVRERGEQGPHVVQAAVVESLEPAGDGGVVPGPITDRKLDGWQVTPCPREREQAAQPVARVPAASLDLGDNLVDDGSLPLIEQGLEQRRPVLEVPIEAALGGAEFAGEWLHAHGFRAAAGKRVQTGGDPVLPRRTGLRGHETYASVSIRMRMDSRLPPGQRRLDRFPRFGTNQGPPPAVPPAPVIEITGAVEAPGSVAVADLPSLSRRTVLADFHCVAGWSAVGLRWEGVPLAEILRPTAAATYVRFAGLDGHWSVMLLEDALADDVLLADRLDRAPLSVNHGAPVRLVAPAHYGFVNVKHLCTIELLSAQPAQSHGAASAFADFGLRMLGYRRFTRARVWEEERHAVLPARAIRLLGGVIGP